MEEADVIVIGGGPAGASAATHLARSAPDLRIVLLERKDTPRGPKPLRSGEVLFAVHRRELARLGVHAEGAPWALHDVQRFRIVLPTGREYRTDVPWESRLVEIERDGFDAALRDVAKDAGVDVRTGHRVTGLRTVGGRATHVVFDEGADTPRRALAARWLVDAGGRFAPVIRERDLLRPPPGDGKNNHGVLTAFYRDFPQERDLWEIVFLPVENATAEISTPVPGLTRIGLGAPMTAIRRLGAPAERTLEKLAASSPELARRLGESGPVAYTWNVAPVAYRVSPPRLANVLLVGDARGYLTPFYGDGTLIALESGREAAAHIVEEARGGPNAARAYARSVTGPLNRRDRWRAEALRVFAYPRLVQTAFATGLWKRALAARLK